MGKSRGEDMGETEKPTNKGGWAEGRNETNKQGRLTDTEKEYIRVNAHKTLDTAMAEELNRRLDAVHDFRIRNRIPGLSDGQDDNEISSHLRKSIHWEFLEAQFSERELKYIESLYKGIVKQFGNDVLVTEELAVIELLKSEVLINRNLEERNLASQMKARLLKLLDKIEGDKSKSEDAINEQMGQVTQQVTAIDNGGQSRTREYEMLVGKKNSIMKDLKGTREQRYKLQEQAKTNFFEWLKLLEEEDKRAEEGELLAIFKRAAKKEKDKLYTPFKYADGMVDMPILNEESVDRHNEENE